MGAASEHRGTVVVVGGGIVGLATARALAQAGRSVVVLEKESAIGRHQTGRNSGVVHAGLYYPPGSLKATMAVAGAASMRRYAEQRGIPFDNCGKLVVAVTDDERPGLHKLAERAAANGVPARLVAPAEAREWEPYVNCVEALRVETTSIIDYDAVCASMAEEILEAGGEIHCDTAFVAAQTQGDEVRVTTSRGEWRAGRLVNCAGLYADRVALASGVTPDARIVPFRGEYFHLAPAKDHLVRGLIYPVPDPRFPFLGVHLTRSVHGGIHVGPNAVLALRREGYSWSDVDLGELRDALSWPGLWRLARRNAIPGGREIARSLSRRLFAASLSRLVPGITAADLEPAPAGVRAQALRRDGGLVDDFLIHEVPRQVHVLNAPSPAATASLEIGAHIARVVLG